MKRKINKKSAKSKNAKSAKTKNTKIAKTNPDSPIELRLVFLILLIILSIKLTMVSYTIGSLRRHFENLH